MNKFKYEAIDIHGEIVKGAIFGDDIDLAEDVLIAKQYQVIQIRKIFRLADLGSVRKLNDEQLSSFCGNVGIVLDSGVTILRGFDMLVEQAENKNIRATIQSISESVRKGLKLSTAMDRTGAFPDLLIDMVGSGEMTSHLTDILFSMENYYKREASVKAKIRSASIYPSILVGSAVLMVMFFNFFVFSELTILFEETDQLPLITNVVLLATEFINSNPLVVISTVLSAVIGGNALLKIRIVKENYDRMVLSIPMIGRVKKNIITARVASSMAIFIKSAIPLVYAMSVEESLVANKFVSKKIISAKNAIERGVHISVAFESCGVFDSLMIQMIRIGEETGKLDDVLFRLSDIYEKKSEVGISRVVSLIEPTFTLVVGLVIGLVILAMALPIFELSNFYK